MNKKTLVCLLLGGLLFGCDESSESTTQSNSRQAESHTIQIQLEAPRQVMEGFGASDAWIIDPLIRQWTSDNDDKAIARLADLLFDQDRGIGLSMWRFNIGAGSAEQGAESRISDPLRRAELLIDRPFGTIDQTKQLGQILMAQEAVNRGVDDLIAFINSPPVWATKNRLAHPGSPEDVSAIGSTNLDPDQLKAFAQFQSDIVRYLRDDRGLPIKYLSPINEPTWHWTDQTQEGNRYNNDEVRDVYLATHAALVSGGLSEDVEIDAGESVEYLAALSDQQVMAFSGEPYSAGMNGEGFGSYRDYIDLLLGDSEIRGVVGNKISLHGYWSDALPERITDLRHLVRAAVADKSPEARIWMSELCVLGPAVGLRPFDGHGFDVNDMDYALHIARIIHHDLVDLEATAWMWWLAVTAYDYKDGLLKVDSSLRPESLEASKLMWALGHFSRFIRPGYQRVDTRVVAKQELETSELLASSYLADDKSALVTVLINLSDREQTLELVAPLSSEASGLTTPLDEWAVYLTNKSHSLAYVGSSADGTVSLPARSIASLVRGDARGVEAP